MNIVDPLVSLFSREPDTGFKYSGELNIYTKNILKKRISLNLCVYDIIYNVCI